MRWSMRITRGWWRGWCGNNLNAVSTMPYHSLRKHLPTHYPTGVVPTREAIAGTAFFPGGHGL